MGRVLTDAAVAQYRDRGYYFPVPVLSGEEASSLRTRLEEFERGLADGTIVGQFPTSAQQDQIGAVLVGPSEVGRVGTERLDQVADAAGDLDRLLGRLAAVELDGLHPGLVGDLDHRDHAAGQLGCGHPANGEPIALVDVGHHQDLAHHTGQDVETVRRDTERDNFMNAQQSMEYGLIDQVLEHRGS